MYEELSDQQWPSPRATTLSKPENKALNHEVQGCGKYEMPGGGLEPPTRGFSVHCSTS